MSIERFRDNPTEETFEKLTEIEKILFIELSIYCLEKKIGNIDLSMKIILLRNLSTITDRLKYKKLLRTYLKRINGKNCMGNFLVHMINPGTPAVYRVICGRPFAVKFIERKSENQLFASKIISELLKEKICPNFPYYYGTFYCDICTLYDKSGRHEKDEKGIKTNRGCVVLATELATGSFTDFEKSAPSKEELYSSLFQIAAAIHTLQSKYQITCNNIARDNIMFLDIRPGGYWKYVIHGKEYHVPNYGKVFVLPVSSSFKFFSPKYCENLGYRGAVIMNGTFSPFSTKGGEKVLWGGKPYFMKQIECKEKAKFILSDSLKKFLKEERIDPNTDAFFNTPDIVPPLEFLYDTQALFDLFDSSLIADDLKDYIFGGSFPKEVPLAPFKLLAGHFITEFFSKSDYRKEKAVMETYSIS